MIVQVIESRYTVDYDILKSYLEGLFKDGNFEIVVSSPKYEAIGPLLTPKTAAG
jgi:hypothetical protein